MIVEKETLEEAAEKYVRNEPDTTLKIISKYSFKDGAKWGVKWMQEISYSEKEMFAIIAEILQTPTLRDGGWEDISKWFEQFKKKNNGKS